MTDEGAALEVAAAASVTGTETQTGIVNEIVTGAIVIGTGTGSVIASASANVTEDAGTGAPRHAGTDETGVEVDVEVGAVEGKGSLLDQGGPSFASGAWSRLAMLPPCEMEQVSRK